MGVGLTEDTQPPRLDSRATGAWHQVPSQASTAELFSERTGQAGDRSLEQPVGQRRPQKSPMMHTLNSRNPGLSPGAQGQKDGPPAPSHPP